MLALTAAIAAGVWHYQAGRERDTRQEWAHRASQELGDQIGQTGAVLVGVRGLFAASNRVEKDEFARFAAIQLDRSNLLGLTWMPRVTRAGRRTFERATGRSIVDRAPDGSFRPADDRAEYFPLRYVGPETPESVRTLGLDGKVDGSGTAVLAIARDTGRPAMSSPIPVGATPADRGTVLVVAVYRTGGPLDTVAQRRAALSGFTTGAWRYDQLAAPILALLPAGAHLVIADTGEGVFDSGDPAGASAVQNVTVGGRPWTMSVSVPRGGTRWVQLAVIVGAGLTLTMLVALLLAQARRRRREMEAGHAEMHREANTDGLTTLGNRRKLGTDFPGAAAPPPSRRPSASSCSTSTASRATTTPSAIRPAMRSWHGSAGAWRRRFRTGRPTGWAGTSSAPWRGSARTASIRWSWRPCPR
jgi:CHASE1-domain containing sensor protein